MTRDEAIRLLRENMKTIRSFGARRIGLFGSVVRGEATDRSDIDVVEFEHGCEGISEFQGLCDYLEKLFGRKVDVLTPMGVENIRITYIKRSINKELVEIL